MIAFIIGFLTGGVIGVIIVALMVGGKDEL